MQESFAEHLEISPDSMAENIAGSIIPSDATTKVCAESGISNAKNYDRFYDPMRSHGINEVANRAVCCWSLKHDIVQ